MAPPCCWAKDDTDMFRLGLPLFGRSFRCGGVGILSPEDEGLAWPAAWVYYVYY